MELEVIISINWPKIGGFHWAFFVHPPKSVEVLGPYGSELLSWMRIWVKSSKRPEFKDIRWLKKINLNKAALLTAETWALGWLPVIYPLGDGFVGDVFFPSFVSLNFLDSQDQLLPLVLRILFSKATRDLSGPGRANWGREMLNRNLVVCFRRLGEFGRWGEIKS